MFMATLQNLRQRSVSCSYSRNGPFIQNAQVAVVVVLAFAVYQDDILNSIPLAKGLWNRDEPIIL